MVPGDANGGLDVMGSTLIVSRDAFSLGFTWGKLCGTDGQPMADSILEK